MNRSFLFLLLIALSAACQPAAEQQQQARQKPVNFVFILVDDLGWKDLGAFGSTFYETPHLDRFAGTAMRFTSGYAASPVCSPTRSSIMLGKNPARTRHTDYFGAPQPEEAREHRNWQNSDRQFYPAPYSEQLAHEETTLAEALKSAGYQTFFAGKWHLGPEGYWPEDHGFDINKGGITRGGPYGGDKYFSPYGNPRLEDGPPGEHLPDRLATETVNFIEQHKDSAFLAYLSFYSVHTPLIARPDLEEKYEKKKDSLGLEDVWEPWGPTADNRTRMVQCHPVYAGMVEAMDAAVGKVLDKLEETGLAENTVVIFMSDNGGLATSEGHPTSNLPLRAGKGWLYEGGLREPLMIRAPGHTRPGSTTSQPVVSSDFYPTMLQLAGLPLKPGQHTDGKSMVPLLKGDESFERGSIFWHYPHYSNQGGRPGSALRDGEWKIIHFYEDDRYELYHLANDLEEQRDLADSKPQKLAELKEKLAAARADMQAVPPVPVMAKQ